MAKQLDDSYDYDFLETYVISTASPETQQYMAVFLPNPDKHAKPIEGYPVFMTTGYGGFANTNAVENIPLASPELQHWRYLEHEGYIVISVGMTGTYETVPGTPNVTSNGRGLFHPPGTSGWADETRYSAPKEAVLAVQMVRERAQVWGANPDKIVVEGFSSGSVAFSAPAFWPDQADPSETDHRRHSSRVLGVKFGIWQTDFRIYDETPAIPANFNHFPSDSGDITTDLATSFSDVPAGYMKWSSALDIGLGDEDARTRNSSGLYVWQHHFLLGTNMTDMTLTGSWGASSGKSPTQSNFVDVDADPLAFHEVGSGVLMAQALRETELNSWHSKNSRLSYDLAGYVNAVSVEPSAGGLIDSIQPFGITVPDRADQEEDWLRLIYGATQVVTKTDPKVFMFEPNWSSAPKVKFNKPVSVSKTTKESQQRSCQLQRFESIRDYTVQYLTSNKFEAREIEHAIVANQGGSFLIPFYPEVMKSSLVDMEGMTVFAADLPNWGYPVFGPAMFDDISQTDPYLGLPSAYYLQGNWRLCRLDEKDWNNHEVVPVRYFSGSPVNLFIAGDVPYTKVVPLERQALVWMDEVMLTGAPKIDHITDTQTLYTINWRSIR